MQMRLCVLLLTALIAACGAPFGQADDIPTLTTLSNRSIRYEVPDKPYVVLKRADIEAVIVDNRKVDDEVLPGHQSGYSGVAALKHRQRPQNIFVPSFAGLNFEYIHDGTTHESAVLFEPRRAPMQLRVIDPFTVELYQKPTPHWKLESCLRYHLVEDGVIEMTLECIPHERVFKNGYIGLFWASYIDGPESRDIHFQGHRAGQPPVSQWIRGVTPAHGVDAAHRATGDERSFTHDADYPVTLAFNDSQYRYSKQWYFGVSHGMALVLMFRSKDQIRFSQSPNGGGRDNPAWDFQFFVPDYEVGHRYQMVMRAMYAPYETPEQIDRLSRPHRQALEK